MDKLRRKIQNNISIRLIPHWEMKCGDMSEAMGVWVFELEIYIDLFIGFVCHIHNIFQNMV